MSKQLEQSIPNGLQLRGTFPGRVGTVRAAAWAPNSTRVAIVGDPDPVISIIDTENQKEERSLHLASTAEAVVWSPDGRLLVAKDNQALKFWNTETWDRAFHFDDFRIHARCLSWAPNSEILASVSDDQLIWVWSLKAGHIPKRFEGTRGHTAISWSPDGQFLAVGDAVGEIVLWELRSGKPVHTFHGHAGGVNALCWSPDGRTVASASDDRTVRLWQARSGLLTRVLEGHTEAVSHLSFAFNGELLASVSAVGTLFLWLSDTDERLACILGARLGITRRTVFGLHPRLPLIITYGDRRENLLSVWEWTDLLFDTAKSAGAHYYRNAKVVLLGDTGVGKSGLSLALTRQPFEATESTHARRVFSFYTDLVSHGRNRAETREALLWDLAGQPGYRLIHQLHLNEVAIALIVIDARSETDPFGGVTHWQKALRQANRIQGAQARPIPTLLVAARTDRGGLAVSKQRVDALIRDLELNGFFATSAKENYGIDELTAAIRNSIDWDALPRVSSTVLFQQFKDFLVAEKVQGKLLMTADDLFRSFTSNHDRATETASGNPIDLRAQFDTCIGLVESRDLIRRLSFGNLVLLQPELLDAFASAIVNAAKSEPDGMGHISEKSLLGGGVEIPTGFRMADGEQQKLLLLSTIEEMLRHEIMLSENTEGERYLVFPSQFTRERGDLPDPEGKAAVFTFEGPITNVYATLIVRLAHSGAYLKPEMWKSAAVFKTKRGGACGLFLREIGEGNGELALFYTKDTLPEVRREFENYVFVHLKRRALPESIHRRIIFACLKCNTPVTELQVARRRQRKLDWIRCPVCDSRISLVVETTPTVTLLPKLQEMDRAADERRESAAAAYVIEGKLATADFDVFLAHNSKDKPTVIKIAQRLRREGLNPWIDVEQIPPGRWFQEIIQQSIPHVKAVAVLLGKSGLGKWQELEMRSFIAECVDRGTPVIPVLLPGVIAIPDKLSFLRQLVWVQFKETVDEKDPLERLVWGITGSFSRKRRK